MERKAKVIVVGGGPAGLLAAGRAAEGGADVLILEKMRKTGRKLCITGKGRCNITNVTEMEDFIVHFGKTGNFLRSAFNAFTNTQLMDLLHNLGLGMVTERGGRVFTASGKATDVLKVLLTWIQSMGVKLIENQPVQSLIVVKDKVTGVKTRDQQYFADAIILATGGASYPATGSTGDGYRLAESVGHRIIPIRPALVPLETSDDFTGELDGLNLRNINASLYVNGKKKGDFFGEISFTDTGVSGPITLAISSMIVDNLLKKKNVKFVLDLKPALDEKKLDARLLRDLQSRSNEVLSSLLRGLMPKKLVNLCLKNCNIPTDRLGGDLSKKERNKILFWLKNFSINISGYRSFKEAIVTAGGVNTREVDPNTMESKKVKGLFIIGELLDIQADTGGYNLQGAFSTGHLAGVQLGDVV